MEEINCGLDFFDLRITIVPLLDLSSSGRLLLALPGPRDNASVDAQSWTVVSERICEVARGCSYPVVATTEGPGQSEPSLEGSPSASVLTNSS